MSRIIVIDIKIVKVDIENNNIIVKIIDILARLIGNSTKRP